MTHEPAATLGTDLTMPIPEGWASILPDLPDPLVQLFVKAGATCACPTGWRTAVTPIVGVLSHAVPDRVCFPRDWDDWMIGHVHKLTLELPDSLLVDAVDSADGQGTLITVAFEGGGGGMTMVQHHTWAPDGARVGVAGGAASDEDWPALRRSMEALTLACRWLPTS